MSALMILAKGGVLLALAALARLALRSTSAALRRQVLASAVLGALCLPLLSMALPSWRLWSSTKGLEVVAIAEDVLVSPIDLGPETTAVAPVNAASTATVTETTTPSAAVHPKPSWGEVLSTIWLLGCALLLGRLLIGLLWTWHLKRSGEALDDGKWADALREADDDLGLGRRAIRLVVSPAASVPTMAGILSPTVCLPPEALSWGRSRRRMVLLHELAHIRHGDNILNLLGQVLCALHWFNPLSWWVVRRLALESEHAADDEVIAAGTRPSDYAYELVHIVRDRAVGLAAASPMAEPWGLKGRVDWILDRRRPRRGLSQTHKIVYALVAASTLVMLSCAALEGDRQRASSSAPAPRADSASLALAVADFYGVSPEGVELTIDDSLQGIVEDEVRSLVEQYHPRSVSVVALDPCNGHVLALGTHGEADASEAGQAFEPGSTMKPFTIAAAIEEGMPSDARFFCENGLWLVDDRALRDATPAGWLEVSDIIARSSTIGTGRIYRSELGWEQLDEWLRRFHFGDRPQIQLVGVESGSLASSTGEGSTLQGVLAANGLGLRANAIQLAAAYGALANDGVYHEPTLATRVTSPSGQLLYEASTEGERLVSAGTSRAVLEMLEGAVDRDDGTGRNAHVPGLPIAGKTGTVVLNGADEAEVYASFVGIVQPDSPQVVILVGVEGGSEGEGMTGGQVAAPAFARIVSRARGVSAYIED